MEEENDIDRLFKSGLNDPEIPFNEMDWEKMEHKLDAQKKKRIVPLWLFTASGIAAVLTIFLLWFFSTPVSIDKNAVKNPITDHAVAPETKKELPSAAHEPPKLQFPDLPANETPLVTNYPKIVRPGVNIPETAATYPPVQIPLSDGRLHEEIAKATAPSSSVKLNTQQIPHAIDSAALLEQKANALAQSKDPLEKIGNKEIARSVQKNMENSLGPQHDLILSAMAAPDISTVKSSKPAKISSNLGMLATYAFNHRISVTSGAIYSKKYYNSGDASQYYSKLGDSWEVEADCNVLDIPLNVNYKLMNKKNISVSVNTGLSSYFMLKEKYEFTSSQPGAKDIPALEINNQNQHLFGIANVSVSFDHKISESMSVGVQPFAKLPLTGIGVGDVNLRSAGVSFSLNIGLFAPKKPGKYAMVNY